MVVPSWLGMDQRIGSEIDLPFLQHQAPHSWGFLFGGMMGRFGCEKDITIITNIISDLLGL